MATENQDLQDGQDEGLYEHYRIQVDPGQTLMRIDKFLTNRLENISRNRVQNAAKAGNIRVNEKPVKPNYRIHPNDIISIVLPEPVREIEVIPEDIPFEISHRYLR